MDCLFFGAICLIVALTVIGLTRALRRYLRQRSWKKLGDALGLAYTKPSMKDWRCPGILRGERDGGRVTITTEERKVSRFTPTWTLVTFDHPAPLGLGLVIAPQGLFSTLAIAMGGDDLETGAADFDSDFRVRASDSEGALRALSADTRRAIATLAKRKGQIQITDTSVRLAREGLHSDPEWIKSLLDDAQAVSRALISSANAHTLGVRAGARRQSWG